MAHAGGDLLFNVTLEYDQDRNHVATQSAFDDLAQHLSRSIGRNVKLVMTQNAERVGERIRTGTYAILLAPAQLVGLAMRNGYTPVARTEEETQVALVAAKGARASSLETARGRRIALPHRESLVSYLVRGEMNALGLSPSRHFGQVMHMNQYGAVTYALDIGQAELVAARSNDVDELLRRNPGARVIRTLPAVPTGGVVVHDQLEAGLEDRIRAAFTRMDKALEARLQRSHFGAFEPADRTDFEFVSTRGFFTPEVLPGASVVTAEQVRRLMARNVPLFDVRSQAQYREGHIAGARNVPYRMNSPKEVDYDDSVDTFDLGKLPQDKSAPMIFQCNGAECWYSYKAANYMVRRGFKKVYWFRTGLPAWKAAGYPLRQGG